jgi:hypothetical protein
VWKPWTGQLCCSSHRPSDICARPLVRGLAGEQVFQSRKTHLYGDFKKSTHERSRAGPKLSREFDFVAGGSPPSRRAHSAAPHCRHAPNRGTAPDRDAQRCIRCSHCAGPRCAVPQPLLAATARCSPNAGLLPLPHIPSDICARPLAREPIGEQVVRPRKTHLYGDFKKSTHERERAAPELSAGFYFVATECQAPRGYRRRRAVP